MAQEKMITFEEVNNHIQKHPLVTQPGTAGAVNICAVYQSARPILLWVSQLPLPGKWKEIIKEFMGALDVFCTPKI